MRVAILVLTALALCLVRPATADDWPQWLGEKRDSAWREQEISRFHVLEPTSRSYGRDVVWSHPAFAERSVFARNDKELVRVSLAASE